MKKVEKIKVGVIGAGFIGPAHIEACRRLGFVEVVAVSGSDQSSSEKKARELGVPLAYGDYRDMLRNPDIQAIHNCTPNHLHYQITKEAIEAGKHVLSEKPLAISSEESVELLRLAKEKGIVHGINFNYRQFPIIQQLASMVRDGDLGKVNLVHGSYLQDWLLYETDYNWRMSSEIGGRSRAIADIGSHWCDLIKYVTGKKIDAVFADFSTVHPVRKKAKQASETYQKQGDNAEYEDVAIDTEDYATVLLRFTDGTKGAFSVSQVSAGRKNRLSFELNGTEKSTFWNQEEAEKLWIGYRDKANEVLMADPALFAADARSSIHHPGGHNEGWPDAIKNMMQHFYAYIRDGKHLSGEEPPFATFLDGHISMSTTDAILKSHATEKWVKVEVLEV